MMNTYILKEEDLGSLVFFSNLQLYSERHGNNKVYLDQWDKELFNEILQNQPELVKEYEQFKTESVKVNGPKVGLFKTIFKDKVDIQSVKELIFANSINDDYKLRADFYKKILKDYPDFLSMMDEEIKKDNGHKGFLYEAYFQIIKSKDTDKTKYTNEEILQNIKKYSTNTDLSSAKKKINTYVSLFDKNKQLYDFIIEDMGQIFKDSPSINNYWEEKLQKFPVEVKKSYLESKESIDLITTQEQYMYTFSLNPKWIVAKHKTSDTASRDFTEAFHMALYDVLHQKLKVTHEGSLPFKVQFIANDSQQLDKLKDFCLKITDKIPDMIVGFNFKGKIYDERKKLQEQIEKFYFYQILDDKLEDKTNASTRRKI